MYKKISLLFLIACFCFSCASNNSNLDRTAQAQGQLLINNQQKIDDLQSQIEVLRGQLEENTYQLNQTIERQKMILQQMMGGSNLSSSTSGSSSNSGVDVDSTPSSQSSVAASSSGSTSSDLTGWTPSGNDKNDYNFIIKFVTDGKQNNEAIVAFQQFLQKYPKSSYLANVNYWLGQLSYRQGKKDDASFYYATVVKDFSSSPKAADSLYKVGLIFLDKGDKAKAKAVFQQVVNKYPKDKTAVDQANKKLASL